MSEILLILVLALIVIGPKKLPDLARALGRGLAEFRRATDELNRSIRQEIHQPLNPADLLKDLDAARAQTRPGPPPGEGPTPRDGDPPHEPKA